MLKQVEPYDVREASATDTDELLAAVGLSAARRAELRDAGVVA
jgi:hypothetical protein